MAPRKKEKLIPEGYRKLKLTYIEPIPVNTMGVYCLFFGNHFYVGQSTNVRRRLSWHLDKINQLLGRTLYGTAPEPTGSYPRIVEHLIKNKDIMTMDACLLYIATSKSDATSEEEDWLSYLRHHELNYLCLNKIEFDRFYCYPVY